MRINPSRVDVSRLAYDTMEKLRETASGIRENQVSDIDVDMKGLDDGIIPMKEEIFMDDTDSMAADWVKELECETPDGKAPDIYHDFIQETYEVNDFDLPEKSGCNYEPIKTTSLQHLTLPETVIYYDLMYQHIKTDDFFVRFKPVTRTDLDIEMVVYSAKKPFKKLDNVVIHYDRRTQSANIIKNDTQIGRFIYHSRGYKLEEIIGKYRGSDIVLDPVWKPDSTISFERIQLGKHKGDLVKQFRRKKGLWSPGVGQSLAVDVKKLKSKRISPLLFSTKKEVILGGYRINTDLLFHQHWIIPVGGYMSITKQPLPL